MGQGSGMTETTSGRESPGVRSVIKAMLWTEMLAMTSDGQEQGMRRRNAWLVCSSLTLW